MNPEQSAMLARIDERTAAIKVTMDRHESSINDLFTKANQNATSLSRIRGIGAGIGGVFGIMMAYLGLDKFGG